MKMKTAHRRKIRGNLALAVLIASGALTISSLSYAFDSILYDREKTGEQPIARSNCPTYFEGQLFVDGKIGERELRQAVATWINAEWCQIQHVRVERYFKYLGKWNEDLAIKWRRKFRLFTVRFSFHQHNYTCTGSDFSPKGRLPNLTFFSLHDCKDTETGLPLHSIVTDLNYSFYSLVTPEFAKVMEEMKAQSGNGNINFQADKAPYLLMPY